MSDSSNVSRRDFLQRLGVYGVAGLGVAPLLTACGGDGGNGGGSGSSEASGSSGSSSQSASGDAAKTVTIQPQGNQMKFKQTEFTVPAGEDVTLVLENTASSPSMQHNVVIMDAPPEGKFFKKVGQAGVQAGSTNDYVQQDMDLVYAYTPIAKPGETVEITFTTPDEAGDYGYVCTYPGHWATMQGTMHVEA
jgi:azurin